jgi:ribosomal-protein-alanine N-acetyltransferase
MLTFDKLTFDNVKNVALLEKECFGDHAWSENLLKEEIPQDNKFYVVCSDNGNVIGYGGFAQVLDEAHIMNIAVSGNYRRQGVATSIIEKLVELAKINKITSLTLEVRENNLPARKLYEKHNFKLAGVRKGYYQNIENACIYWRVL